MNSTQTRLLIRQTFLRLYAKHGLHGVTVTKVCKEVPIARTTFYAHYADIYAILDEIIDEIIHTLKEINSSFKYADLTPTLQGRPFWRLDDTLNYIQTHAFAFKALLDHSEARFIHRWKTIVRDDFRARYEFNRITPSNLDLVLEFIASAMIGTYSYWVSHSNEISVQEIKDLIFERVAIDFL